MQIALRLTDGAMVRCRLKRTNFKIITKMSKENETSDKTQNGNDFIPNVSNRFSEQDMIDAAEYGYNYRDTTSFPEKNFQDNCKNNVRQWLTKYD